MKELVFLDYLISSAGVKPSPENINSIADFPIPRNYKMAHSFLDLCSHFRRFVKNIATLWLAEMWEKILFLAIEFECFENVKQLFISTPVFYSPHLETQLYCDATSLAWKHIPTSWCRAKVVYIPKVVKTDQSPKSLRPISLTSFLLKTLEKLVDRHLRGKLLLSNPLNADQYAYQADKSTELALNNLVGKTENTFESKGIAVGIFLDIKGTFNNALPSSLQARGAESNVCGWIQVLLTQRTVRWFLLQDPRPIESGMGRTGWWPTPSRYLLVYGRLKVLKRDWNRGFLCHGQGSVWLRDWDKHRRSCRLNSTPSRSALGRWIKTPRRNSIKIFTDSEAAVRALSCVKGGPGLSWSP